MESNPFVGSALAIGPFDAGLLGAICNRWQARGQWERSSGGLILSTTSLQMRLFSIHSISCALNEKNMAGNKGIKT